MQFGIKAVELLIDVINNGKKPARRITLETELIIRESCGAQKPGVQ
jgi:LacI family transcriptional regulator